MPGISASAKPLALFDALCDGFARAESSGAPCSSTFELGGYPIQLCFASPQLAARVARPFAHLAASTAPPELRILLWDSASTRTALTPHVRELVDEARRNWEGVLGRRGELLGYNDARIRAAYAWSIGTLSSLDTARNLAVFWVDDAKALPTYEQAAPLKTILNWWLSQRGLQFVHGGAVGAGNGGVLLAGKGGSGKSTTALACLGSPLRFAGDDYCLAAIEPAPHLYSVYSSARLASAAVREHVPQLQARMEQDSAGDEEKQVIYLAERLPDRVCAGFPLQAIVVPHVTNQPVTTLAPMRPAAALQALALTTMFQLAGDGQAAFHLMAQLVNRLPCYRLALGSDLVHISDVLLGILSI